MGMKRCGNGHFYDDNKYQQCPYCGISTMDSSRTMPIIKSAPPQVSQQPGQYVSSARIRSMQGRTVSQKTVQPNYYNTQNMPSGFIQNLAEDDNKTIGIVKKEKGIDPVVGWVVCIEGPTRGVDYRLKAERNFIGRDPSMDIAIIGDMSVSRENHAIISYNPKNNGFRILPGDGHGLVYVNDDEVFMPVELKTGDIIELGQTKLIFVALCDERFQW